MLDVLSSTKLTWAVGLVAATLIARFFAKLHAARTRMRGLPGPPHSYFFGHLLAINKSLAKQPPNAAPQTYFYYLKEYYDLGDIFYVDTWPFGPQMLVVTNIDTMQEMTVKASAPKHPIIAEFMKNFGGSRNLVSIDGSEWKRWRSVFNPGFAPAQLMSMTPIIVDECRRFVDIMSQHAKDNDLIRMERAATKLTVNIIGRIVLDVDFKAWEGGNPLLEAFNSQVRWQAQGVQFQPSELWDIRRPIIQAYNNWTMNRYLRDRLEERFATRESRGKTKHVVDLALEAYMKEVKGNTGDIADLKSLDPEFLEAAISNMITFVFAGHDTTSSTICYAFYYLCKDPEKLARIRREHDEVFGTDPNTVGEQISKDPYLLNKLDYTLAVFKEVLRLQPPASTVRATAPGLQVHNPETGEAMVTDGFMLWPINVGIHRNARYWPDPEKFNPDRFIQGSSSYAENNQEAWIPFSKGNRNCIGQELAIIETKVILAMIIRTFDVKVAYDEIDKLKGDGSGYPSLTEGILEQFGERGYQIQLGTAKPSEGLPCRLRLRSDA